MTSERIRVAKLGGSLLALDDLAHRLEDWLGHEPPAKTVMIVGGGPPVEMLRRWSIKRRWSKEQSHWSAIHVMGINARRMTQSADDWPLISDLGQAMNDDSPLVVLDVEDALRSQESGGGASLPYSWEVTSDSIAAWLAIQLGTEELVLFKSVSAKGADLEELSANGVVDSYFPEAAAGLVVRIINLA